jgi:DNA-directed RNA polymerase subunit RPC12/RpoP
MHRCYGTLRKLNKLIKWTNNGFIYDGEKYSPTDINNDLSRIGKNIGCHFKPAIIIVDNTMNDDPAAAGITDINEHDETINNDTSDNSMTENESEEEEGEEEGEEEEEDEEVEQAKYSCSKCGIKFLSQTQLSKHINVNHVSRSIVNRKRNNKSMIFPNKNPVIQSSKQVVSTKRNHDMRTPCWKCGKEFTRNDNLKRHLIGCSSIHSH